MRPRSGGSAAPQPGYEAPQPPSPPRRQPPPPQQAAPPALKSLDRLDPSRCALIIQDMQNDVVMDGGAFASSGSPAHCTQQNAIANAHAPRGGLPRAAA